MRRHLEKHFDAKDARETVVEVGELLVPLADRVDGVLGGQGDGAGDDHKHDEHVEQGERHDGVDRAPETKNNNYVCSSTVAQAVKP